MAPITVEDLTVDFRHVDRAELLSDWEWKLGPGRLPILITALGHAFVQDVADGTVHRLDTAFGELDQVAASPDELSGLLADRDFVTERLDAQLFGELREAGMKLAPGQVFSFRTPPALGGEVTVENIEATDLEVHFSITGQIHRQIDGLPEGTPIPQIRIDDP